MLGMEKQMKRKRYLLRAYARFEQVKETAFDRQPPLYVIDSSGSMKADL